MKSTRGVILTVVAASTLFIGAAGIVSAARPSPSLTPQLFEAQYTASSDRTSVSYGFSWIDYRRIASYDLTIHNDTDDREIKHLTVATREPTGIWNDWAQDPEAGDHSGDTYTLTIKLLAKNGTVLATEHTTYPKL